MLTGFGPETMDFLWGIRMNNERGWFEAHKQDYVRHLYEPMKALGAEIYEAFRDIPGLELKVSRIYRDARLHPPTPYKESLWICIRRSVEYWGQNPALYFEIRPEGASYGFLLWQPKPSAMDAFRTALTREPDRFPKLLQAAQTESGLNLTAECYKRPKPAPSPELEPFFAWKSCLSATRAVAPGPALFTPDLGRQVRVALRPWLPVCDYFYAITNP